MINLLADLKTILKDLSVESGDTPDEAVKMIDTFIEDTAVCCVDKDHIREFYEDAEKLDDEYMDLVIDDLKNLDWMNEESVSCAVEYRLKEQNNGG